jgi:hypothetical protein
MGGKRILSDAPGLFASAYVPPRGLSFSEWWQTLVAARRDARLLTPECSLNRLLGPGTHPAKARVLRDYYLRAYRATAAALYGVVTAPSTADLPYPSCELRRTSLYEGDVEPPEQASRA